MCLTWLVWPQVEPSFTSAPQLPGPCRLQASGSEKKIVLSSLTGQAQKGWKGS